MLTRVLSAVVGVLVGLAGLVGLVGLVGLGGLALAETSPAHAMVDRDCGDFSSQAAAQAFFLNAGGPGSDPHRLDADGDGIACETRPCPCSTSTSGGGGSSQPATLRQWARVVRVVDGDTVDVRLSGHTRRVRLLGIDSPEMKGPECGARSATRSLRRMLPKGTRVLLVSDPTQARKDRYGRLLRYVVKNGRYDVDRLQVRKGWARVYVYGGKAFKRVGSYRDAQRYARSHDRGTWGAC